MDRVRRLIRCNDECVSHYTGKGVCVAVLDSGVSMHPDFSDRIIAFRDFTEKRKGRKNAFMQGGVKHAYDDNGHGTHV